MGMINIGWVERQWITGKESYTEWLLLIFYAADLYRVKHPLILCTDDPGVFSTTISQEYALAASCFELF